MAGHNDLGVLGHLAAHVLHERLIWDHVASTQPPAAQAKVGQLLKHIDGAPLRFRDVYGHLHSPIHCCLQKDDDCIGMQSGVLVTDSKWPHQTAQATICTNMAIIWLKRLPAADMLVAVGIHMYVITESTQQKEALVCRARKV